MTRITVTIERDGPDLRPVQDIAHLIHEALSHNHEPRGLAVHRTPTVRSIEMVFMERKEA